MNSLILAAILDYMVGDPWGWPHPVRLMGWIIDNLSGLVLHLTSSSLPRKIGGTFLGLLLILGSGLVGWIIIHWSYVWYPLGIVVESVLLASCFAGRSLRDAAIAVMQKMGDLEQARQELSKYVGRDTANLSEADILRAVLETVSENAIDGVMAPLFYAIVGSVMIGIGAVPLALGYKAASTLDSMIGYKKEPYQDVGWFSAKTEDLLTWIPCRLTVITLGIITGKLDQVWQQCEQDAIKDPSPNSGWSECAYATILGVQLGGINWYQGIKKEKPLLGLPLNPISIDVVNEALRLTRDVFLIWLGIALGIKMMLF